MAIVAMAGVDACANRWGVGGMCVKQVGGTYQVGGWGRYATSAEASCSHVRRLQQSRLFRLANLAPAAEQYRRHALLQLRKRRGPGVMHHHYFTMDCEHSHHWHALTRRLARCLAMDFCSEPPRIAKEGALVLLQERRDVLVPVVLKAGTQFQNRHGLFSHDAMIGKEFGSKVRPPVMPSQLRACVVVTL